MKILFINSPVIRDDFSSAENDFSIKGIINHPGYKKIKGLSRTINFINKFTGKEIRYGVRAGSRWPFTMSSPMNYAPFPFIMGYAASYLKSNGFEVNILDAVAEEEYSYERFIGNVKKESADIVVVECSTPTIDIDLWVAKKISEFSEVALAGTHITSAGEQLHKKNQYISYLLKGEYIISSLKMSQTRKHGIYESEVVSDLNSIPFPYRDFKSATKYYDPSMKTLTPQLQIWGSKGCPFKCSFCLWPQAMYQGNVSLRSPDLISKEINDCKTKHGYRSIFFDDDTFNLGTERISKLCDRLADIGLPWTMMGRLDLSPDWLYDKMVSSGCVGMRFGVESFNLEVLKKINKGLEDKNFVKTLEYITTKHPQLMIHLTMMKDLPGQTEEMHRNDIKILNDLGYSTQNIFRSYQLASCAPFPGTALYNELMDRNINSEILEDYKLYDGGKNTVMKMIREKK